MLKRQEKFKELIGQGKVIEEYVGREVLKEGSPIIILEGYEWISVYISMYCEGSEYEHSNRGKIVHSGRQ